MIHQPSTATRTPLSVEKDFRTLLQRLSFPWSARRHLEDIEAFLRPIYTSSTLYESYILEIVQRLPDIVNRLNTLGMDPAALRPLYNEVKELLIRLPSLSGVPGLGNAMQKLRSTLSVLYHVLGEEQHGNEFQHVEQEPPGTGQGASWTQHLLIPVVERNLADTPGTLREFGYLRKVSIEILGSSGLRSDEFLTQVLILGHDGGLTNTLTTPVLAARSLLLKLHPRYHDRYFRGYVTFDELNAFHQGASANLAIAALLSSVILRYVGARGQLTLNPHVTMTGDLNERGTILSVDADSLKLKTEAVFFSDIEYFVVPREQTAVAEEVVTSLTVRYPHRHLTVIGMGSLEELFFDRRLTSETTSTSVGFFLKTVWRHRIPVAIIAAFAVLVLFIVRNTVPPPDDNPVTAVLAGERLLIENEEGETLEEIQVGSPAVQLANGAGTGANARRVCKFFDIDGDGKNEFVYVQTDGGNAQDVNSIVCRSLWRKIPRWQNSFHETAIFPDNPVNTEQSLVITNFVIGDFEKNGVPELFLLAHHLFFPSMVFKLNALTGATMASYLNTGHLGAIATDDINDDGIQEVFVGGWNSAFNAPCLIVLDPRLVGGHSPTQGKYRPDDSTPGTEVYYILIPPSIPSLRAPEVPRSAGPSRIRIDRSNKLVGIDVADLNVQVPGTTSTLSGNLTFTFNHALQILNVNTTTTWDQAATILAKQGSLRNIPTAVYLNNEYKKLLMYWDGERWQHKPVMNGRYLQALKDLRQR